MTGQTLGHYRIEGPLGRGDPVDSSQGPIFRLLGVPLAEKRHQIFESGHVPTEWQEVMKEVLDWLDRYLGPAARG